MEMTDTGWIRVSRKTWNHPLFASRKEPMTWAEAWLWMIAQAAWKDYEKTVSGHVVTIKRGAFLATQRQMQAEFCWPSKGRVERFLTALEREKMIDFNALSGEPTNGPGCGPTNGPRLHVISICNYSVFQDAAEKTSQQTGQDAGQQTGHYRTKDNKSTKWEGARYGFGSFGDVARRLADEARQNETSFKVISND